MDPMAVVQTEETRSVLALSTELPSLAELAGRPELQEMPGRAAERWDLSWEQPLPIGRRIREGAYQAAAAYTARALEERGIRRLLDKVDEALLAAQPLMTDDLDARISAGILRAGILRAQGERSLESGHLDLAVKDVLGAADALRELGPQAVAQALVARAQEALDAEVDVPDTDLDRARHLALSARLALDDRDWTRALQRAYYACQLLGVSPG
jgi:hypothetical protein